MAAKTNIALAGGGLLELYSGGTLDLVGQETEQVDLSVASLGTLTALAPTIALWGIISAPVASLGTLTALEPLAAVSGVVEAPVASLGTLTALEPVLVVTGFVDVPVASLGTLTALAPSVVARVIVDAPVASLGTLTALASTVGVEIADPGTPEWIKAVRNTAGTEIVFTCETRPQATHYRWYVATGIRPPSSPTYTENTSPTYTKLSLQPTENYIGFVIALRRTSNGETHAVPTYPVNSVPRTRTL